MKQILLVEDDPFLSTLLKTRLRKEGLDVLWAKNGNEALSFLEKNNPGLVLMDIILPEKSGFETMEKIISDPRYGKVPIMIISNLGQESDIARGKELGAIEYFIKAQTPIDEIIKKVKNFLSTI